MWVASATSTLYWSTVVLLCSGLVLDHATRSVDHLAAVRTVVVPLWVVGLYCPARLVTVVHQSAGMILGLTRGCLCCLVLYLRVPWHPRFSFRPGLCLAGSVAVCEMLSAPRPVPPAVTRCPLVPGSPRLPLRGRSEAFCRVVCVATLPCHHSLGVRCC